MLLRSLLNSLKSASRGVTNPSKSFRRRWKKLPRRNGLRMPSLSVERLEERAVPTIIFQPVFGAETVLPPTNNQNYITMSNAQVDLIFWGASWGTATGNQQALKMNTEANHILSGTYLSKLKQYGGSNGVASLAGAPYIDTTDPIPAGYSTGSSSSSGALQAEIAAAINNNNSPTLSPSRNATQATAPIYVVIVDPLDSGNNNNGGYNFPGTYTFSDNKVVPINMVSIGTNTNGSLNFDIFTRAFGHEIAERMSDPTGNGSGIQVNPNPLLPQGVLTTAGGVRGQIGDYEPSAGGVAYSYRLGTDAVQPYWSRTDNAFVVADGNTQTLTLSPKIGWTVTLINPALPAVPSNENGKFNGTYSLTINGDQFGLNTPDQLTILSNATQTTITLNGETFDFDPNVLSSINVSLGGGNDMVNIKQTVIPITINDAPNVNIGAGFAYLVNAPVTIHSPNVKTALTLDDSADKGKATINVRLSSLQLSENGGPPLPAIQFDQGRLSSLTLDGGPGSPVFNLAPGVGSPLDELPQNITISGGGGESVLSVFGDTSADNAYTISGQSVKAFHNVVVNHHLQGQLTNDITYSGLGQVIVSGNDTGSSFFVQSTIAATPVVLFGGLGPDTFQVGSLVDSLDGVLGKVTINGFGGGDSAIVNDTDTNLPTGTTISFGVNPLAGGAVTEVTRQASFFGPRGRITFNATIDIAQVSSVSILGNGSNRESLVGPASGAKWAVTANNSGSVGSVAFSDIPNLVGAGPNIFDLSPAGQALTIHGGGAGNWLDYTAFPVGNPVTVNLATGSATNVGGGAAGAVTNIQNVWGGAGANSLTGDAQGNVLVGGGNTGVITGGSGRSVLVGGGANQLVGHSDSDLLIAGALGSALNEATLPLVLQEWQRTDIGYGKRITDLEYGGGQHGSTVLTWGTAVIGDNGGATLTGGPGQNWFFANLHTGIKDTITNLISGEQVNNGDFGAAFSIGATTNTVNGGSGNAIATDSAGNVYFGGAFSGTTKVGSDSFTTTDQFSGVVAKYTPSHALAWADAFIGSGGSDSNVVLAVATDVAGNVYLDDTFSGTLTVGSFTLTSSSPSGDSFVAKLNSAGVVQWVRQNSSPTVMFLFNNSVAVDASGDSYVSGDFQKTLTIGSTTLTAKGASFDGFFAKLDPNGNVLLAKNLGGTGESSVDSIAVTDTGTILLGGVFNGTVTFGSSTFTAVGDDGFVSKLNSSGQFIWTQPIVDSQISPFGADAAAVVTDTLGDVYVSGPFSGSATFGATTLPGGTGRSVVFVAKLNSAGTFQWAVQMGNSGDDETYSLAIDAAGNLYTAGYYQGTATFGSTTLTASADFDSFVAKLNSAGSVLWADDMGGPGNASAAGVAADGAGDIYSTGDYGYTDGTTSALAADFDAGPATYDLTSQDTAGSAYVSEVTQPGAVTFTGLTGVTSANYRLTLKGGDIQLVDTVSGQVLLSKVLADTTSITITAASGVNTTLAIDFSGGAYNVPVTFKGGTGDNTLLGPNVNSTWTITGTDAGAVGNVTFSGVGNLVGGTAMDVFTMMPKGREASINGGDGGDWLSYSAYTTGVSVDLATGKATGISGLVSNIENVMGGTGNDQLTGTSQGNILDGNGGNDVLIAGSGASVLIGGGAGSVTFNGGAGQDIMIPGITVYDNNFAALDAILAEWQRTDLNYTQRINDLEVGGGLNGSNILTLNKTVLDDGGAPDTMTGGTGMDWFFQFTGDTITNLRAGEQVNNTPPGAATNSRMAEVNTLSNPAAVFYRSAPASVVPKSNWLEAAVSPFTPLASRHNLDQFFISGLDGPIDGELTMS
jgi:hypothetical protein